MSGWRRPGSLEIQFASVQLAPKSIRTCHLPVCAMEFECSCIRDTLSFSENQKLSNPLKNVSRIIILFFFLTSVSLFGGFSGNRAGIQFKTRKET